MTSVAIAIAAVLVLVAALYAALEVRYALGRRRIEEEWRRTSVARPAPIGTTRSLEILPLVDWYAARPGLRGEPGVSYLIKTDRSTILLDVGLNLERADPSPLEHNLRELDVSLAGVDTIVISHNHADHVGGIGWMRRGMFSPGNTQPDLRGKRLAVPVSIRYPGSTPEVTSAPTVIAPGVATTGTIASQLFMGRIDEQALAVNVEGKGIVLIVGCGHQTLPKLLARQMELFGEPLYGVVGGLHYPIPRGRLVKAGLDLQNLLVFGLFHAPRREDVQADLDQLARRKPQWISLSAHDSSDETIEQFRRAFGAKYRDLRVGEPQRVGA